jgi:LytS/YehU family sensor histidine kinase
VPPEVFHFGLGILLATFVGRSLAEREAGEFREAALRHQTEQARALALQAQMQPHALFNALSGLVELAHDDPEATEAALVALCDYLRRVMAHATLETAPLRGERELLEDYLRIEQIRLGERLRVAWDWPAWVDGIDAPPFLLQPLVENAVLHGIAAAPEGGELRIAVHRTADQLVLKVENTGLASGGGREGLGLGHLRERLRLWGRGRAALELVREGDWTRARLTLPLPD